MAWGFLGIQPTAEAGRKFAFWRQGKQNWWKDRTSPSFKLNSEIRSQIKFLRDVRFPLVHSSASAEPCHKSDIHRHCFLSQYSCFQIKQPDTHAPLFSFMIIIVSVSTIWGIVFVLIIIWTTNFRGFNNELVNCSNPGSATSVHTIPSVHSETKLFTVVRKSTWVENHLIKWVTLLTPHWLIISTSFSFNQLSCCQEQKANAVQ